MPKINLELGTELVDRLTDHALRAASLARAAAAAVSSAQTAGRDLDAGELQQFHRYRLQLAADLAGSAAVARSAGAGVAAQPLPGWPDRIGATAEAVRPQQ
ncbi:MAG: hypothetical protein AB7G13_14950 [Lautropia sp.]